MECRGHTNPAISDSEEPSETTPPNSPSLDDIKVEAPSPKKRKKMQKKVVSVPISEVEGSKSKSTDTYPPSDSWSWRKYGQKSIKGSPYPRGYYRCSSAKGCPAKKQVERSRSDPTMLVITYACDHNHEPGNNSNASTSPSSPPSTPTISNSGAGSSGGAAVSTNESASSMFQCEDMMVFRESSKFELPSSDSAGVLLDEEFGWFNEIANISVLESPICSVEDDVAWFTMEEDDALFADLGELPECSAVFRRSRLSLSTRVIACGGNTR